MKKINFQKLISNIKTFLSSHREVVFLCLSIIAALLIGFFLYCNQLILWAAIIVSLTVYWRLPSAYIAIENETVRGAWACINFILFITICNLCSIEPIEEGYTKDTYIIGVLVAMFVNGILYTDIIPKLSYKMKFIDRDYGHTYDEDLEYKETKSNGSFLHIIIYLILLIVVFSAENKQLNDYKFEKEPFVSVQSWDKEIYNRNTVYIVKTEKGIFGISPYEYPEIRYINANTKIKVLKVNKGNHIKNYSRLEIQN